MLTSPSYMKLTMLWRSWLATPLRYTTPGARLGAGPAPCLRSSRLSTPLQADSTSLWAATGAASSLSPASEHSHTSIRSASPLSSLNDRLRLDSKSFHFRQNFSLAFSFLPLLCLQRVNNE